MQRLAEKNRYHIYTKEMQAGCSQRLSITSLQILMAHLYLAVPVQSTEAMILYFTAYNLHPRISHAPNYNTRKKKVNVHL